MTLHLEDLPDELLLDIFAYLSPIDLFITFAFLNNRINAILCDQSAHLGVQIKNDNHDEIDTFVEYFTHVSICGDEINIHLFNNVRSLTLGPYPRPTDETLSQLVDQPAKHFPYLTQLIVHPPLSTWYSQPSVQLWTQLFTNKFSSRLKHCSLMGRIFGLPTIHFYCPSLRSLSIGGCSLRDLPILLAAVPNLRYLSTDVWGVADVPPENASFCHSKLSHLYIKFMQQTVVLEEFCCVLLYIPYLKVLTIESQRKHDQFDVKKWYELLISQLQYLKKFNCTIRLADTSENEKLDIDFIRRYHRLFSKIKLYRRSDGLHISNQ